VPAYDPEERLVYTHSPNGRLWWASGAYRPPATPRDVIWVLAVAPGHSITLTFDLRTLKLYAKLDEPER